MKLPLRTIFLLLLVSGTLAQDDFNLFDALDDPDPTPPKPEEKPKAPEKPKNDGGLDLLDAFGLDETPTEKPKKPSSRDSGGFGLDLEDALGPEPNPKPDKPNVNLPDKNGGGGGNFGDSDLLDIGGGDYKPDGGHSGGKGQAGDSGYDQGGDEQPQEAGSGQIAGIVSAIGMALAGAAGSYIAYQKKKLCFKIQGGTDPESGKHAQGSHSDPQVFSNLLRTN
ncbi:CD99 molecule isoform X1 [Solea solea]|uniref:CD99 molecule isoform X1 n=1 Tax=Solea solea TaxID=90069 RepID=UPI00272AC437|nr:CD99 molecule isoform X1 [Solea solea]